MSLVEVFEGADADEPIFVAELSFMPRAGEYLSYGSEGYFKYYNVVEVWHSQEGPGGKFVPRIRVELDD